MRIVSAGWDLKIFHQGDRFFIMGMGDWFVITLISGQIDIQATGTLTWKNRTQRTGDWEERGTPSIAVIPG